MTSKTTRKGLFATTMLVGATIMWIGSPHYANAQDTSATPTDPTAPQEVVVTGSRIRRAASNTAAPVTYVNAQDIADRGYVSAGQALNDITAITPSYPEAPGNGNAAGSGQTYPNLFNLGAGRTLSLVDGHRFVTSTTGGDRVVDTNIIPIGLLDRIDVVQAGGAAVYGSDAIAGVINYVLKKNFEGVTLDVQGGISSRGDYPEDKVTAIFGKNFDDGKGNIAVDLEYNQTRPLLWKDRPETDSPRVTSGTTVINNATFWEFNQNGVIFAPAPAPVPSFLRGQFSSNGQTVIPYNPGTIAGVPFASGGDGTSYKDLAALETGVRNYSGTVMGHYDFTPHLKLSGSLFYADTRGDDPLGSEGQSNTVLNSAASGLGAIRFNRGNPFLTTADITSISALYPAFGAGAPVYLSKQFDDLLPTRQYTYNTDDYRGLISLDGDFNVSGRNFYYSASYSRAQAIGSVKGYAADVGNLANALNATTNAAGQIVCAINATTVTNPACAPLNPFGVGNISAAARNYVSVPVGETYHNTQDDILLSLGGDLFALPAGQVKFSVGYEHRREADTFDPAEANQLGLVAAGVPTLPTHGSYDTNEYSAEVLVPVFGPGFNFPLARTVELSGQYRLVDNSLAGSESVYGVGLRWEVVSGLTFRASRSRNFRAPTLDQLLAPSSTNLSNLGAGGDPCDNRYINAGANPAARLANCQALFAAHPGYGSLAAFQDTASNFNTAQVTSGGNSKLQNEISNTTTYGVVFQPKWVPGQLTINVDRIEIDLENGLTALTPGQFLASCYDNAGASNAACTTFTRDASGNVNTALSTTFNAASVRYRGEEFNADYRFPVAWLVRHEGYGALELQVEATHNESLRTNVAGALTQVVGTVADPRWVSRFDIRYTVGPLRVTYQTVYMPNAYAQQGANSLNNSVPVVGSNTRQDLSASYDFSRFQVRAGITNFTDERPSFPTLAYGDIIGREFFVGLKAHF